MNIDELREEAERLGYELVEKPDEIFLLSVDEYEKYKHNIPQVRIWWWLRSHGRKSNLTVCVSYSGSVLRYGDGVCNDYIAVRPAIRISNIQPGERVIKYDFPWIGIDYDLAIAEVPIAFRRFDEKSNDYETSEIRQFLKDWLNARREE